ncbi:MAG: propanediol utilization protein [Paracoccaceae bacterium]|nr:propanediol utilization protein [Paracoccaceae bacterium]
MIHQPGHFGELLQGRLGPDGPVVLVTLPCPTLGVRVACIPGRGLRLHGGLPPARARALLARLGLPLPGRVILRALAAPGTGTGVSTAGLIALARLAGWGGPPEVLARACIAIEGASDPLMFPAPERVLWASRLGRVIAPMPALPRFEVLGGFFGPAERTDAADTAFPDISDLVDVWQNARGLKTFAALASESAARSRYLRGPTDDPMPDLARELGALGWCRAYTGAARGLIFAPGAVPAQGADTLRAAGLRNVMRFKGGSR